MNKKDVENIGYILSETTNFYEIKEQLFKLDKRIEEQYESYKYISGRHEQVDELFDSIMNERYGPQWPLLRVKPPVKEVLEEARRQVYGDDYEYIFKN